MQVQCISSRPGHRDTSYDTGEWGHLQVKNVPDDIARRMLMHADVYATPGKPVKVADEVKVETVVVDKKDEEHIQEMTSKISLMTNEQAREFIERNFKQKVDLRKFKDDGSVQRHALNLFNQYGGD